ncbi:MAG: S46 family peptidase [Planctomycetales bacterium]|nr:S46 family peptidase [Planctomycetales bacterium]
MRSRRFRLAPAVASARSRRSGTNSFSLPMACIFLWLSVSYGDVVTRAEEGMFPMSELAQLDLSSRGIELAAQQLFNPADASLVDGVCRVNTCTGSFVSSQGLIITNHHCAYDAIQKASTPETDYLHDGFTAKSLQDEIPALDYTVRVTEDYRDVSAAVLAAVDDGMSFRDRTQAIDKRRKELESAAESEHPGLRAEVAEMFTGKTYVLFLYTYLKDIRLVFAPPQSIGNFGGEDDNWMWPRHTGDFSFMRAYTAPDGSSATYHQANIPYQPKRYIPVEPRGVDEGDAVFLLGYPGRTSRHKTAAFLAFERDIRLPTVVDLYQWQIDTMQKISAGRRDLELKHASRIRSLANVEKRSRGQLKGLQRKSLVQKRAAEEESLRQYITSVPEREAKYGPLLDQIAAVYAEMSASTPRELLLTQLRIAPRSAAAAFFLVDSAYQRQKPDLERESDYMDRNFAQSIQNMQTSLQDFHAGTDAILLAGIVDRLRSINANEYAALNIPPQRAHDLDGLKAWAIDLVSSSLLGQPDFFASCLEKAPETLAEVNDPLLQLILRLYPAYASMRELEKEREGQLSRLYGSLVEVKQAFLATRFIPDANATLRFTCGHIRRYSPEDAVIKTPITTLGGVVDKTTGIEPFVTPQRVLDMYAQRDFGRFRNEALDDVPVAILYDTDTTGGNSGSPIMNSAGKLVGVNFDRCFEATINDFAWDESYSRSIGVDIRYVLWITGNVYGANHLLSEMGVSP